MLLKEPKTRTRQLGINAAFLQEVKEDNRFLDELIIALLCAFSRHGELRPKPLVQLLSRLRDLLAMHFALEEAVGYCEEALDIPADVSANAARLRAQHVGLYLDISEIVDAAERILYHESNLPEDLALQRLASSYANFCRRLRAHDANEARMVEEALMRRKADGRARGGGS